MPLKRNFDLLKSCDLNLLTALSVLLKEAHVTRAAQELGLSQSAMSQVLKRLRLMFADPLLVKGHQGMTLTNKAITIEQELHPLLDRVIELLETEDFDPITAKGRIRFIISDVTAQLCIGPLLDRMQTQAPHLEIEYLTQRRDAFHLLRRGQIDLIVGFYDTVPKPICSEVIATVPWQMVTLNHAASTKIFDNFTDKSIRLLRYQYQEHNQIHVINALKKINAEEATYALTSGSLSTMIQALKTKKTATLIPHYATRILTDYRKQDFNWLGEPIELELKMCWNQHSRNKELHQWFRHELTQILLDQIATPATKHRDEEAQ